MLDNWMLSQYFHFVHLDHSLSKTSHTPVTFYHEAAPLMLLRTGDDSVKGTPFLTSIMNFMQFRYMYSSAYFSIKLGYLDMKIPYELLQESKSQGGRLTLMLPTKMARNGSHLAPKLHDFQQVQAYTSLALFS